MDEATQPLEIGPHAIGIDDELVHQAGQAEEREIERDGRVRPDHALDG